MGFSGGGGGGGQHALSLDFRSRCLYAYNFPPSCNLEGMSMNIQRQNSAHMHARFIGIKQRKKYFGSVSN